MRLQLCFFEVSKPAGNGDKAEEPPPEVLLPPMLCQFLVPHGNDICCNFACSHSLEVSHLVSLTIFLALHLEKGSAFADVVTVILVVRMNCYVLRYNRPLVEIEDVYS